MAKKLISIVLSVIIAFSAFAICSFAGDTITEEDKNGSTVPKDKIAVCFRTEVKHLQVSFEVKTKAGWRKAGGYIDARHLSTESAGGFTGCVAGVYVSSNGRESNRYVDVLQLEYGNRVV